MYRVPPAGPAWHAAGARLERGVRHCCVDYRQSCQGWHEQMGNDTVRHSSKVSACRRGLNNHNATKPRAPGQSQLRARDGPRRAAAGVWCSSPRAAVLWLAPRLYSMRAALPNPSFKPSPNGVPRRPGRRYAYIFATRARASHRWCRLNSNVRRRKSTLLFGSQAWNNENYESKHISPRKNSTSCRKKNSTD